ARVGEGRLYRGASWKYAEDLMRSYFAYGEEDRSVATVGPGTVIDMTTAAKSSRYKDGNWGAMDFTGSWIEGRKAAILFAPPQQFTGDLVAYVRINEAYLGVAGDPMYLRVSFEGEQLCRWTVYTRYEVTVCKAVLPSRLIAGKNACRLEIEVENPQSADKFARESGQQIVGEDPRELGVKIQKITFTSADRLRYSLGDTLDFTEAGEGAFYTNECWTQPDGFGNWTLGTDANLVLLLKEPIATPVLATFTITDDAVSDQYPLLDAEVSINGRKVAEWKLGTMRLRDERKVLLPDGFPTLDPVNISFHVPAPRSPLELKWSSWDKRPLGFRLTAFRMEPAGSLKYRLGESIDLTDGGNSAAFVGDYLGTQWALPDNYGSWTVGDESTMRVRFEEPATSALPVSFIISDCMVSKSAPSLAVRVKAGGRALAEWEFKDREVHRRSLDVPADLLAGAEELILTFEVATPRSPASLGWTSDSRPLGIRLARVAIGRSDVEMPAFGMMIATPRSLIARIVGLPGYTVHVARILWRKWNDR
ncbi:MAG TPA: hypothetical protein VGV35_15035, partial [Bryobacteraceae bacterium]|nr:hypothetical protein [Bryobacteraceae bacterium]